MVATAPPLCAASPRALEATVIDGVATNLALLRRIVAHEAFRRADLSTRFLADHASELLAPPRPAPDRVLIAAAAAVLVDEIERAERTARTSADPHSPWVALRGWRLHGTALSEIEFDQDGSGAVGSAPQWHDGYWRLRFGNETNEAARRGSPLRAQRRSGTRPAAASTSTAWSAGRASVVTATRSWWRSPTAPQERCGSATLCGGPGGVATAATGSVTAPIPGRVVRVLVSPGQPVARGETLVVLEAMKTELRLASPCDGVVRAARRLGGRPRGGGNGARLRRRRRSRLTRAPWALPT
ncbi:MAG: biotin/lipoyl-containing protein [Acetobacteraceae bacterium]|nr:biotin/lipoyl-containing protein [Acetobacteraceae bacterium]